jgi:hypothetical protein
MLPYVAVIAWIVMICLSIEQPERMSRDKSFRSLLQKVDNAGNLGACNK